MIVSRWTGPLIKALRKAGLRMSQRELADELGFQIETIQKWEQRATIDRPVLGRSAEALDTLLARVDPTVLERFRIEIECMTTRDSGHAGLSSTRPLETATSEPAAAPLADFGQDNYDVRRRDFGMVAAVGAVTPGTLMDLIAAIRPTPTPAAVGLDQIEEIRDAAKAFSSWDNAAGRGLVREAVAAQVRYAASLLDASCSPQHKSALHSAVGFLSHSAGFMAFDRYEHQDAETMFELALWCAEAGQDWHLRAKVHSSAARQSIWRNRIDDGLTSVEQAFVRADRLTPTERAMLHTTHARALAKQGRVQETLTAIGRADEEFAHSEPSNDPPWMAYYDLAQHSGDTGHALFDLAINGEFIVEAGHRLTAAVQGHSDAYLRSRAISATKLASLVMATGDPAEASSIGRHALVDAGHLRSRRAADDLRELRRFARVHAEQPQVAELNERIDELLPTS
ncbi:helix-turn-helix domain-containing protein [Nocardia sp. NPDC057668]|uniref:helix-turn-helix domain-containing protein n=1 Tax=Nocardia sp. NPDC057668 TaxID=3346202 RepID=UPI00366D0050